MATMLLWILSSPFSITTSGVVVVVAQDTTTINVDSSTTSVTVSDLGTNIIRGTVGPTGGDDTTMLTFDIVVSATVEVSEISFSFASSEGFSGSTNAVDDSCDAFDGLADPLNQEYGPALTDCSFSVSISTNFAVEATQFDLVLTAVEVGSTADVEAPTWIIQDTAVPLVVPSDQTVVFFSATPMDNEEVVSSSCVPPSGSVFPVGQDTTVTCTATDSSDNVSVETFTVRVESDDTDIIEPVVYDESLYGDLVNVVGERDTTINARPPPNPTTIRGRLGPSNVDGQDKIVVLIPEGLELSEISFHSSSGGNYVISVQGCDAEATYIDTSSFNEEYEFGNSNARDCALLFFIDDESTNVFEKAETWELSVSTEWITPPTASPTLSLSPSTNPSSSPSTIPSSKPSSVPSSQPSSQPSMTPSSQPSSQPSITPSSQPSMTPSSSTSPSMFPSFSHAPSVSPSGAPSVSAAPSLSQAPTNGKKAKKHSKRKQYLLRKLM